MLLKMVAISLLIGCVTGCAAKSAYKFSSKDVAKAHINPKYCRVIYENGDLDCNHVRVVLATVPAIEQPK